MKLLCVRQFNYRLASQAVLVTNLIEDEDECWRISKTSHRGLNSYSSVEDLDDSFEGDFTSFKLTFKYQE